MTRVLPLAAALLITACTDTTLVRTTENREAGPDGMLASDTRIFERKLDSVMVTVRSGSETCMNRIVEGPGGRARYSSTLGTAPGHARLVLSEALAAQGGGFGAAREVYRVDLAATGKGTAVTISGGDARYLALDVGVRRWVNGGSVICPVMPAER